MFGVFTLTFSNSANLKVSSNCLKSVQGTSYLFTTIRDPFYLPKTQVNPIGSIVNQPVNENIRFLIQVPIQTDGSVSCSTVASPPFESVSYVAHVCQFSSIFSFTSDFFGEELKD